MVYRTMPFAGGPSGAANYLLLYPGSGATFVKSRVGAPGTPKIQTSLQNGIRMFINRAIGRRFSFTRPTAPPSASNDWDYLIWDLLDGTARKAVKGSVYAKGAGTYQRGQGTLSYLSLNQMHYLSDPKLLGGSSDGGKMPPESPNPDDDDGDWQISLVHIVNGGERDPNAGLHGTLP